MEGGAEGIVAVERRVGLRKGEAGVNGDGGGAGESGEDGAAGDGHLRASGEMVLGGCRACRLAGALRG